MSTTLRCLLFALLTGVSGIEAAETSFQPQTRADLIAPYIDELTIAVAHADLSRVPVGPVVDWGIGAFPIPEHDLQPLRQQLDKTKQAVRTWLDAFAAAGGKDIYLVVSLSDSPPDPWFMILPLAKGADEAALGKLLRAGFSQATSERLNDVLFVGRPATLERIKTTPPDPRPDLLSAFKAAGDTRAQVLLLPPRHARRVIEEMMPTLPAQLGGGPSTAITRGFLWASVGGSFSPPPGFHVGIQAEDQKAAEALRAKLDQLLQVLAQWEDAKRVVPNLAEIAARIEPSIEDGRLVLEIDAATVSALLKSLTPPVARARTAARRSQARNSLKQIGLALHRWHDRHRAFPAPASRRADGQPLLSWRVHILPFLDKDKLYKQFRLDEPWDSQHNRGLINRMPAVFRSPGSKLREKGRTSYLLPVGPGTVFPGREALALKQIKDGASRTILVVEVDDAHTVVWTKPQDFTFNPEQPLEGLGGPFEDGFQAVFCDGHVSFLKLPETPESVRALFSAAADDNVKAGAIK